MLSLASSSRPPLPALRELGYEEGRDFVLEVLSANGNVAALPDLALRLVASRPDVLLGVTNPDVVALKRATSTIPIVMMYVSGPVETGLVATLTQPGGNVTGTTTNSFSVAGKMVQVLRDSVPGLSQVTWLAEPDYPGMDSYWRVVVQSSIAMGIRTTMLPVRSEPDLSVAFAELERVRPDAIGVSTTGVLTQHLDRITGFAAKHRLPALYSSSGAVRERGGLMSYGPDFRAINRRIAGVVDKILKGTRPADIPVEEPAKFVFVINVKTARSIGLNIPRAVLLQADELVD
jgi:putative ABC transport system substrate-binding protein